jgi:anti-sigma B factor antagonist
VRRPEDDCRPKTSHCDLRVERTDTLTYVALSGELDLSCKDRFADAVDAVDSERLVLDLRRLTFIDSSGLRMILGTWRRSQQEGFVLEIVRGRDQVERVFRLTGIDGALPMTDEISLNGHSANPGDGREQ